MNQKVRTYLIETARQKDKFVYYSDIVKDCGLDIDTNTEYGRKQLSIVLGEVSAFENNQIAPRPLLSSLAIYKDKKINDHGDGFYKIAEQLGKGNFKQLRDTLYAFVEAKRSQEFWQNNENYEKYALLTQTTHTAGEMDFFTRENLDFFREWQLQPYNPQNAEHVDAKNHLMNTVWEKSIYLGNEIIKQLNGFELEGKKIWHQRGWAENGEGENVQSAIFKPYTWVKIFRNTDKGKDIFFTFGIDAHPTSEAFIYKIDCQDKRDSKLSTSQIELCKSLIPQTAKWNKIIFEDLLKEDWHSLTIKCVEFINQHTTHYDAIIDSVWGEPIPSSLFKNQLAKKDKPKNGLEILPETKTNFNEVDVDFQRQAEELKDLGDAGEELVKQREIQFLNEKGLNDKALLVKIEKDGKGYDVFSFDENGNEKFIEVKTTTGNEYTPFYLSENELNFMRIQNKYSIYRIFNYDAENNFGEFFELSGLVEEQLLMKPIEFKVYIKKNVI